MKITVPATSANLGCGFDSIGIAVNRYLTIEVLEKADVWQVEHTLGEEIPSNADNLLIETALQVKSDLVPHRIKMTSDIPLTRGLGSSSSVIVAGIELANQLGKLELTQDEKLNIACKIEGHPDNVAPALLGNLVVASFIDGEAYAIPLHFPYCALLAYIPNTELSTKRSREVLPSSLSFEDAVKASAISNVMIAALSKHHLHLAGKMIEQDLFHEKYRTPLVPEITTIREIAKKHNAYATYLSGAGPTVMMFVASNLRKNLALELEKLELDGEVVYLEIDRIGVNISGFED
ncbi:homoserine kinase [Pilibacter termitis]|uniref:Homoserine kinase n=1 Tax=Pilibacter termitis TaxID=263852 RepID=A0A1T4QBV5_9ENTE|nr:homoserine kinase [Pilibacter termitis]SKA01107.1 homoserine kinase [Pilibacter termitis]